MTHIGSVGSFAALVGAGWLAAALAAAPVASLAVGSPAPGDVLAEVDGTAITVGDLLDEMKRRGGASGRFRTPEGRAALLEELVRAAMVDAAARREGYDRRPEIAREVRLLIMGRYLAENLEPVVSAQQVSDDEVQVYYAGRGPELALPRMVRGAVIRIEVPAKASEEKRAELRARAEAARAAALALPPSQLTFGSVAVAYSSDQATRYRGGDLGLMREDKADLRWDPAVLRALFALGKPGDISPVVVAPDGFYLLKLAEVREAKVPPLAEVRDQIGHRILQQKKRTAEEEFFAALRTRVKTSVNRPLLEQVTPPAAGGGGGPPALPGN